MNDENANVLPREFFPKRADLALVALAKFKVGLRECLG